MRAAHARPDVLSWERSTWFPLIDRNPQTWVPNIFQATAGDYRAQTHRVWRTPRYPSRVEIQTVAP